jgi:hypothetical protein
VAWRARFCGYGMAAVSPIAAEKGFHRARSWVGRSAMRPDDKRPALRSNRTSSESDRG